MSKYSSFFLVSNTSYQKIGGKIRLRKFGSWLAEEAWIKEEQAQKRAVFSLRAIELAKRIAEEKGIPEDEAFQILQGVGDGKGEVVNDYTEEMTTLMQSMPSNREQLEQLVTVFMKNRCEVMQGKKWEPTPDWSNEDTKMLPKNLIDEIERFMVAEEMADTELDERDELEEETEEAEKN